MIDFGTLVTAGAGGAVTWFGQSVVAFFKARAGASAVAVTTAANVDQHRDRLTFDLLQAAREEVAAARAEAGEMRQLQGRLSHYDEALDRIDALLRSTGDDMARELAERHARAFLVRMGRAGEYHGGFQ